MKLLSNGTALPGLVEKYHHPVARSRNMASTGESSDANNQHPCSLMRYLGVNWGADCTWPCPITAGAGASYGLLAVNMFNPDLMHRFSPSRDLTNIFMGGSLIGGSLYLCSRPHLAGIDKKQRIIFSVYGSTMVTLGSLLLWAMARVLLPDNAPLRTVAAVGSSIVLLKTGQAYLNVIDSTPAKKSQ